MHALRKLRRRVTSNALLAGTVFFALTTYVAMADPEPSPSISPLTPEALYLRAIAAMKNASVPPYITFREMYSGRNFRVSCSSDGVVLSIHHGDTSGAYDVFVRTRDDNALSKELVHPAASPCPGALLIPAGSELSRMGTRPATPPPATQDASAAVGGPAIIGAIRTVAVRDYRIEFVGREALAGNDVYHLHLQAYRDPNEHPLTDLYIDPATFLVREARGEGDAHFVVGSGRVAGTIDFDRFDDYWLVKQEHFEAAANALLVHARLSLDVTAENVMTPTSLPEIAFPTHTH